MSVSTFPRIVRFLGTDDCPGSSCPHCGCTGRYIHRFQVADGRTLAAMSGCVKLFPISPIAQEEQRLRAKEARNRKLYSYGLNCNDSEAMDAIEAFYANGGDERCVLAVVRSAKNANAARFRSRRSA